MSADLSGFPRSNAAAADNSALGLGAPRRSVGPYRDAAHPWSPELRAVLRAHREAVSAELEQARAAAARIPVLEDELAQFDALAACRRAGTRSPWVLGAQRALVAIGATVSVAAAMVAVSAVELRHSIEHWEQDDHFRGRRDRVATGSIVEVRPTEAPVLDAPIDAGPVTPAELDAHVRWIAPQAWEIDASFGERLLRQSGELNGGRRLIPVERDGNTLGVRIHGVHRDSIAGRLGIESGDVLIDVNGVSVASPDDVLALYARARSIDAFFVRLERDGQERIHAYRVVRR